MPASMDFIKSNQQRIYCVIIDTMLQEDLDNINGILKLIVPDNILEDELKHFVLGSSKKIRSVVSLLYFRAQNFEISDNIYRLLVVGELVHNASLLHDDVIDDADVRRGVVAFNKKHGSQIAILSGDYLLGIATDVLVQIDNNRITKLFSNCLKKMCETEINQFFTRGNTSSETDYIKICEGKTGTLFSTIMESVAILLDSDTESAKKFGAIYGLMFQVKNDLESISAENDKKNNLHTAVDVMGIEKTKCLLDNCRGKLLNIISDFPQNKYRIRLEDLIQGL